MCKGGTGQGVTLALSIDETIGSVRSLQMPEWVTDAVDFSSLSNTDWMCFLPASLADPGTFTAEIFFDSDLTPPSLRIIQTATITFPIQTVGNVVSAILTGSGFITSLGFPNAAIAEPLIQTITFKYDGEGVVPAFTTESAS